MRAVSPFRLAILCTLLVATTILVHGHSGRKPEKTATEPLRQVSSKIEGWRLSSSFPMDARIVEELKLDDYLFQSFARNKELVTLYIGYYRTAKKVGAAHDPQGADYRAEVDDFRELYRRECFQSGIDYVPLDTSMQFDKALLEYLIRRSARG